MSTTEPQPVQITLPVEGMTCAACQSHVQRALRSTPGVAEAAVNLMMHSATVAYDPRILSPEQLVAAINDSGYDARLPEPEVNAVAEDEVREAAQRTEYREFLTKALTTHALGLLAMVLSMPLMAPDAHASHAGADPLQRWVMLRRNSRRVKPGSLVVSSLMVIPCLRARYSRKSLSPVNTKGARCDARQRDRRVVRRIADQPPHAGGSGS